MIDLEGKRENRLAGLLGLILAFGTLACYWPARHFEFINLDDPLYVYGKRIVQKGLTWPGFVWAFQNIDGANWNPLVWLSQMADAQLFGANPGGHHLVNVLLHTANVLLLFLVLKNMTGAVWRSALVAAVFAWHPMHVESVAWLSERKDVLSTFFTLLALGAYSGFVKAAGPRRMAFYALAVFLFALGLMTKPMVVTLPLVLLLLDYWPLQRPESMLKLAMEKAPFFILSVAMSALTIWTQQKAGAMEDNPSLPLRLENAAVSCARYVGKLFWPTRLAVFYPFPNSIPIRQWAGAALLLAAITWAVIRAMKKRRYLGTGWLWFLMTLLPVIGIIHVGLQGWADRFTYIPYIGLAMMMSWGLADLAQTWPRVRVGLAAMTALALLGCLAATRSQLQYWQNNVTLYEHALKVTSGNYIAHSHLADALVQEGKADEAVKHYQETDRLRPGVPLVYNNLGEAYAIQNKMDEARAMFAKAIQLKPDLAEAHFNLGTYYLKNHQLTNAIAELQTAARQKPDDVQTQANLAGALVEAGQPAAAISQLEFLAQNNPDDAHIHFDLGMAYLETKQPEKALFHCQEAARLAPDVPQCLNALAWIYATCPKADIRNGPEAVPLATRACELTKRQDPSYLDTLAAAYAEAGRFDDAVKTTDEILVLAKAAHNTGMEDAARQRLELYKARKPYREGQ